MSGQSIAAARPFLKMYHDFLEEAMSALSKSAFKVAFIIYRETVGWKRDSAPLSLSVLQMKTGLSRPTVTKALKEGIAKQFIRLNEAVGLRGTKIYGLAERFLYPEQDMTSKKTLLVEGQLTATSKEIELVLVKKFHQNPGQNFTSSSKETLLVDSSPVSFEAAPEALADESERGAKETLKEKKEILKESEFLEEEEKEEEEDEPNAPEWETVLEQIKPQVSKGAWGSWFRSTRGVKRGDQFIIKVESTFHKAHIKRYAALIMSLLEPMLPATMDIFIATVQEAGLPALAS